MFVIGQPASQMDRMGDALKGAMTDVMHNVWACCTDDAQTGGMTDKPYDVQTEGMYDVCMDGMDNAWTVQ